MKVVTKYCNTFPQNSESFEIGFFEHGIDIEKKC